MAEQTNDFLAKIPCFPVIDEETFSERMRHHHLLITMDFPPIPGGISNYLFGLWKHLSMDRSVLMCGGAKLDNTPLPFPIRYAHLPRGTDSLRRHLRSLLMIPLLLSRRTPKNTVLHCGQVIACGLAGAILNRIKGTPFIAYLYGAEVYSAMKRPLRKRLLSWILRRAALVVTISEYTRALLLEAGCSPTKIAMVRPGVPILQPDPNLITKWRRNLNSDKQKVVLSVARLVCRKGHLTVLKALSTILPSFPNLLYVICGDGPFRKQLEETVSKLGLENNVMFLGHVPDNELSALYAACDIFVLTPFEDTQTEEVEGFGIVYLEAGAQGKAVVGSNSGGIPDAIADGVSGILIPPQNAEKLAEAIRRLLGDDALRKRLGAQGKERVEKEFAWPSIARVFERELARRDFE